MQGTDVGVTKAEFDVGVIKGSNVVVTEGVYGVYGRVLMLE